MLAQPFLSAKYCNFKNTIKKGLQNQIRSLMFQILCSLCCDISKFALALHSLPTLWLTGSASCFIFVDFTFLALIKLSLIFSYWLRYFQVTLGTLLINFLLVFIIRTFYSIVLLTRQKERHQRVCFQAAGENRECVFWNISEEK